MVYVKAERVLLLMRSSAPPPCFADSPPRQVITHLLTTPYLIRGIFQKTRLSSKGTLIFQFRKAKGKRKKKKMPCLSFHTSTYHNQ